MNLLLWTTVVAAILSSANGVCEFSPNTLTYQSSASSTAAIDIGQCTNPSPTCSTECVSEVAIETLSYETVTGCTCPGEVKPAPPCEECHVVHNLTVVGQDALGNDILVDIGATCEGYCERAAGLVDLRLEITADDVIEGIWVDGVPLTLGPGSGQYEYSDLYYFSLDRSQDHVIAVHWRDNANGVLGFSAALHVVDQLPPSGVATSPPVWGTDDAYLHQFKAHLDPPAAGWEQPGFNDSDWTAQHYACHNFTVPIIPFVEWLTIWNTSHQLPAPYYCFHGHNPVDNRFDNQFYRWYIKATELQAAETRCVPVTETRTASVPVLTSCECDCPPPTTACAEPTVWNEDQCRCVPTRGGLGQRSVDHDLLGY